MYVTEEAAQLRADQEEARSGTAGEDIGAAAGAEVAVAQWWWAAPVSPPLLRSRSRLRARFNQMRETKKKPSPIQPIDPWA